MCILGVSKTWQVHSMGFYRGPCSGMVESFRDFFPGVFFCWLEMWWTQMFFLKTSGKIKDPQKKDETTTWGILLHMQKNETYCLGGFIFFSIRCFIFCVKNNLVKMNPIWLAHFFKWFVEKTTTELFIEETSTSTKKLVISFPIHSQTFPGTAWSIHLFYMIHDRWMNFSIFLEVIPLKTIMTFECFRHLFQLIAYQMNLDSKSKNRFHASKEVCSRSQVWFASYLPRCLEAQFRLLSHVAEIFEHWCGIHDSAKKKYKSTQHIQSL